MERLERVRKLVKQHGQEHLLLKYDELDETNQRELLDTIEAIDFDLMHRLYHMATKPVIEEQVKIEPIPYIDKNSISKSDEKKYIEIGEKALRSGELAVVTMAGGQGTRLGFNGPKGAFIFYPEKNKSIFEALTETLKKACDKYNVQIPWYIMTSKANNAETIRFFEEHDFFGYPEGKIKFFIQGELPMLDFNGRILLDEFGQVKLAANGHGGTLFSMEKTGVLQEMKESGIKWVSVNGVDNVLVKPIDPLFIGLTIKSKVLGAIKSISKTDPEERVGVICSKNGKVGVVEYTEISKQMANLRDTDGKLVFGDAYALFNLYSIKGLEKVAEIALPYHVAVKKANYLDVSGNLVVAESPNAYKFEMFIFDSYEMFDEVVVLRINRDEEFAPIKNAIGNDSPETALAMYKKFEK